LTERTITSKARTFLFSIAYYINSDDDTATATIRPTQPFTLPGSINE